VSILFCDPLKEGIRPEVISEGSLIGGDERAEGTAAEPAAALNARSKVLAAWSRIRGRTQVVEAAVGPPWGAVVRLSSGPWAARPCACALEDGSFLVVWDELAPEGGAVRYAVVDESGGLVQSSGSVFAVDHPGVRFINASCAPLAAGALVSAVRIEDVVSPEGVVDQRHAVATARLQAPGEGAPEPLETGVRLDHGLLSDSRRKDEVWGYLGHRLRPVLLAGGRLCWERKELHEGRTTTTTGVLCCRDFDPDTGGWGPELVIHAGGLAYDTDRVSARGSHWVIHRPVIQGKTHRLALEEVPADTVGQSPYVWAEPSGYGRLATPPASARLGRETEIGVPDGALSPEGLRLYWGDTHVHSALSLDCEGEPDELLFYARHRAGLDFVALTENDEMYSCWLSRTERHRVCDLAEAWTEDGVFVALNGFEYTLPAMGEVLRNHRTVLLPDRRRDLFRWSDPVRPEERLRIAGSDHTGLDGLASEAERLDAVMIGHHDSWRLTGSGAEAAIEAVSGWDTYMHDPARVHTAWRNGRRLGLVGGSDGHRRMGGHHGAGTGVWASELSLEGIVAGLRARRTVATQGRRPRIAFCVTDERGTRLFIGDHGRFEGRLTVHIDVEVEAGRDDRIELVELRNGEAVLANWGAGETGGGGRRFQADYQPFSYDGYGKKAPLRLRDPAYLYLRIRFSGPDHQFFSNVAPAWGPWAWTSPIWWDQG